MKLSFNRLFYKRISFYSDIGLVIALTLGVLSTNSKIGQIFCAVFILISLIDLFRVTTKRN